MSFSGGQTPPAILLCISSILIICCPNIITGFNISQVLNNYEDCYTFNRLLSENELADQINHLKTPVTVLAVSQNETIFNERYPISWKPQLVRHIILFDIEIGVLESLKPNNTYPSFHVKKHGYSTLAKNTKIYLQRGTTGPHNVDVRFEEYEGDHVKYRGQTYVKSIKHSVGSHSTIVVNGLLYDHSQELKTNVSKYDPRFVSTSTSSTQEQVDEDLNSHSTAPNAPSQSPKISNEAMNKVLFNNASKGSTNPPLPPSRPKTTSSIAGAGRTHTSLGLLCCLIFLALA